MGLSLGHLLILAVVLLLFGTKRLPDLASALGKSMRAFREALNGSNGGSIESAKKKVVSGQGPDASTEDESQST